MELTRTVVFLVFIIIAMINSIAGNNSMEESDHRNAEERSLSMSKGQSGQISVSAEDLIIAEEVGNAEKEVSTEPTPPIQESEEINKYPLDRTIWDRINDLVFAFGTFLTMLGYQIMHHYWPVLRDTMRITRDSNSADDGFLSQLQQTVTAALDTMRKKFETN